MKRFLKIFSALAILTASQASPAADYTFGFSGLVTQIPSLATCAQPLKLNDQVRVDMKIEKQNSIVGNPSNAQLDYYLEAIRSAKISVFRNDALFQQVNIVEGQFFDQIVQYFDSQGRVRWLTGIDLDDEVWTYQNSSLERVGFAVGSNVPVSKRYGPILKPLDAAQLENSEITLQFDDKGTCLDIVTIDSMVDPQSNFFLPIGTLK